MACVLLLSVVGSCGGSDPPDAVTVPEPTTSSLPASRASLDLSGIRPGGGATAGSSGAPATTLLASVFQFVEYRVFGGAPARNDRIRIYPDGRVEFDDGSRAIMLGLPLGRVEELQSALGAADVGSLGPVIPTSAPGETQALVLYGGRSVRFPASAPPESLRAAVAILDREVARARQALE